MAQKVSKDDTLVEYDALLLDRVAFKFAKMDHVAKVWNGVESLLNPIKEACGHSKAITNLAASGDIIYSG